MRDKFVFQSRTQSIVASVGESEFAFDFIAAIIIGANANPKVDEIVYDFKIKSVNSNVGSRTRMHSLFVWCAKIFRLVNVLTKPFHFIYNSGREAKLVYG